MPRVEIEEGHEEIESDGRGGGNDEIGEDVIAEHDGASRIFELPYHDEDGGKGGVNHDDAVDYHRC